MKKDLFRSKAIRTLVVLGAVFALPVSAASADSSGLLGSGSTSIFATAQGTSVLGTEVPILGTQGYTVTLPVGTQGLQQAVGGLLDFTVAADVSVGDLQVVNLDVDPHFAK